MKLSGWQRWGITARLVMIATVPSLLMFMVGNVTLYLAEQVGLARDLQERGQLVAAALAENSRYGIVSGNPAYLEGTVRGLLETDRSIAAITVLDARRQPIAGLATSATGRSPSFLTLIEVPVGAQVVDVDSFGMGDAPHVSLDPVRSTGFRSTQPIGYVQVTMSPLPLIEAKRQRLIFGGVVVLMAGAISALACLYLARLFWKPLHDAMHALREIRQGRYEVRLERSASGELGELQDAIAVMADVLHRRRQKLEDEVTSRTRDLEAAVELVKAADAQKRRLIARADALVEGERRRIASEIHDDFNASIIVARLAAQHIEALAPRADEQEKRDEIAVVAQRIATTMDGLYAAARKIVKQLRPEMLDTLGLRGAIADMIRSYDRLHPACRFDLQVGNGYRNPVGVPAITAYRLVQEALSNIVKHAGATVAVVSLEGEQDGQGIRLTVSDNGSGFDPAGSEHVGVGLIGMRERVSATGGSMEITSGTGIGTTVTIHLPCE